MPVKEKEELCRKESDVQPDFPSVEYRGVFINDKEELEHWAQLHMKEDTMDCMRQRTTIKEFEKADNRHLKIRKNFNKHTCVRAGIYSRPHSE